VHGYHFVIGSTD